MAVKKIENKDLMDCLGRNVDFLQCNVPKPMSDFYDSWSPYNVTNTRALNKKTNKVEFTMKTHYCKACLDKIYQKYRDEGMGLEEALYHTLALANIPFIAEKVEATLEHIKNEAKRGAIVKGIFGLYYSKLKAETSKHHLWKDFSCTDIDYKDIATKIESHEVAKRDIEQLEIDWGKQEPRDYAILTEWFVRYTKDIEFENQNQEDWYRDLCLARLRKRKMEEANEDASKINTVQTQINTICNKLKIDDFESNKPKSFADKTMFNKLLTIDEKNVQDVYKEPTKYFDHNKFVKYQKESTLRPMLEMLIGHSDFGLTMEDLKEYKLDE